MSETNLTTTITSEEYKFMIWNHGSALRLAEAVCADWLESIPFGFNKPSDATLAALRNFDSDLYFETERKVRDAEAAEEAKRRERMNAPTMPAAEPGIGWPYKGIEITCESGGDGGTDCHGLRTRNDRTGTGERIRADVGIGPYEDQNDNGGTGDADSSLRSE